MNFFSLFRKTTPIKYTIGYWFHIDFFEITINCEFEFSSPTTLIMNKNKFIIFGYA